MKSELHKKLQDEAVQWLRDTGCFIADQEVTFGGAQNDVVGIKRNGVTYCVEVKATEADLQKARQDYYYQRSRKVFHFYYLYLPHELNPKGVFDGWGIIKNGQVVRKAKRNDVDTKIIDYIELLERIAESLCDRIYGWKGQKIPEF